MDLQETRLEINKLKEQMTLTLDNPKSVKLQVKNISLIQKQLRVIKKEVNLAIKEINQEATQALPDSIMSLGLDLFGKRKLAGRVRQENRKAIQSSTINARQPYMDVKDYVDQTILEGDKLKLKAAQYLSAY
ncbi:MAG: hypothetical protein P5702_20990 [Limnospira sp. PMC 1291.21]|uniref:hypothetical protein n=1 Tax=unclassified Limnospira TaxID=2642885 RepID=UPI0028E102C8|nr:MULTISPECIES: hypothetical protein [unclassified Limnospira]MDT9180115.1 hypothetical protein [Limnospira sp. PMC 1238.20]MDT9195393.1 hypothetical protein [Limnospira sp. PMC 1245.20]MDT9205622.1 hypothetical protein [Limnospira sp. PMC 1243.20]MDT9210781.1 hypothetical protein [Limnospira sp. PMC 1252.20]MDT9215863.1 hypothetical protein [Limnospira sp. PMC 1256.20]